MGYCQIAVLMTIAAIPLILAMALTDVSIKAVFRVEDQLKECAQHGRVCDEQLSGVLPSRQEVRWKVDI
jgi:hypothetical protein